MVRSILTISICCLFVACSTSSDRTESTAKAAIDSLTIELTAAETQTVLELLQSKHEVHSRNSAMGLFVNGIDSIVNSSSAFWVYSVNDSMAKTACDKYILSPGDRLKWHFRKM